MSNRNSDSASFVSGAPLSPFSSVFSVQSEVTSDEPPDLGDFATVFRALNTIQQQPRHAATGQQHTDTLFEGSEYDSDAAHSTVWDRDPVRSYLSSDQDEVAGDFQFDEDEILSEREEDILLDEIPTLGALDSALVFLAGEHEKLVAKAEAKETQSQQSSAKSTWQHVVSPKRKRRRKRKQLKTNEGGVNTIAPTPDLSYSSAELSSSPEGTNPIATPGTGLLHLKHSQSTPNLLVPSSTTEHHMVELRNFAVKLAIDFPDDSSYLEKVPKLSVNEATGECIADPRGPSTLASSSAPPVHIFIDHSNILIGFLRYIKQHPPTRNRKPEKQYISHAALTLLLERGRAVGRRVMVGSSPLIQPMDTALYLGYEVRVYARIPNIGDSDGRIQQSHKNPLTLTDSDSAAPPIPGHSRTSSASNAAAVNSAPSPLTPTGGRVRRYREQGVDELLQLKLHQAIVDTDHPPPGSTIVLATGDGAIGEFNDDGFLGCVRSALKKGWKVELYAWEEGLSRSWTREFGGRTWGDRFKIIRLEKYGAELLLSD